VLPILIFIVLLDVFYLDYAILPYAGIDAILLPLFVFIFNLPHIIASFFSFFDNDYISYYKKHLFFYLPLVLIATTVLLFINPLLGFVLFLVADVWHGVKQKVGIALILGAKPNWIFRTWMFIPFLSTSLVFAYLMIDFMFQSQFPDALLPFVSPTLFIGAILIFVSMLAMVWQSKPKVRLYIFCVSMFFLASYFFVLWGYVFFAILAFRFVHDVSAFAFYITHDYNRFKMNKSNWLYNLFSQIPLSIVILTPVLGYLFAYLIRQGADGLAIGYGIIVLIGMSHFYLEGIMWKRNSPHRKHVSVND
jgi:hypothetical protein